MNGVTRERPQVDRVACPWLFQRFVERGARLLYVPADHVMAAQAHRPAAAYPS